MALDVANRYVIGAEVEVYASIANRLGEPTTPTVVTFTVQHPDGTSIELSYPDDEEVVEDSEGELHLAFIVEDPGRYDYRVERSGDLVVVGEGSFVVLTSRVV